MTKFGVYQEDMIVDVLSEVPKSWHENEVDLTDAEYAMVKGAADAFFAAQDYIAAKVIEQGGVYHV